MIKTKKKTKTKVSAKKMTKTGRKRKTFWQRIEPPKRNHDSSGHNSSNRLERFSFFSL
jgi:hypothetical protein